VVRSSTEGVIRFLGRHWPDARLVAGLIYHVVDVLGSRADTERRVVVLPGGAKMVVTLRDYAWRQLYFKGSRFTHDGWLYEPETTRFVLGYLRAGDTFIDIGANAGYYTLIGAAIVGPSGSVHAFEPNPQVVALLRESVHLNRFASWVRVNAVAVSANGGIANLFRPADPSTTGAATTVSSSRHAFLPAISVPSIALDQYFDATRLQRIRLVKIDVEGGELEVISGALKTFRTAPPDAIICEFCPELLARPASTWRELVRRMRSAGYVANLLRDDGRPAACDEAIPHATVANVCFLRAAV
jgi:FkbM family methyltransferase